MIDSLKRIANALEIANQLKQDELMAKKVQISNPLI